MAVNRWAKVSPSNNNDDDSDDEDETKIQTGFVSENIRRLSMWFQRSSSTTDIKGIKDIPGQSFALVEYLLLRTLGLETFTRKIEKLESTVFRFNLGAQSVFLCDWKSVQNCFDPTKLVKERRFGRKIVNRAILDDYTPSMFANGIDHAKKKSFMINITRWVETKHLLSALVRIIPEHLKSWNTIPGNTEEVDLEANILQMTAAIVSEAFFGTMLEFECMQTWKGAIFRKQNANKPYQRHALEAYDELYNTIVNCPRIEKILVKGRAEGLTDDETVKEVFFAAVFNGFPAISYILMSLIGRLTLISTEQKLELKEEMKTELQDGLSRKTLKKLKKVENFVLEVLRMQPPAPLLFGRARYDFVTESNSCYYQVKKDEMLVGSIYQVQRDPSVYENPCEFHPNRYEDKNQKRKLIVFGGNMDESPKAHTHKCPGQGISMTTLKVVLLYMLHCKIKLKEEPVWSGKKLKRFGRPDNPLQLEEFLYKEPSFTHCQSLEIMEYDDAEDDETMSTCSRKTQESFNGALAILKISGKMKARVSKKRGENIYEGL